MTFLDIQVLYGCRRPYIQDALPSQFMVQPADTEDNIWMQICQIRWYLQQNVIKQIVSSKLHQQLRTESGMVYGVDVTCFQNPDSVNNTGVWIIHATCDISAVAELESQVLLELHRNS